MTGVCPRGAHVRRVTGSSEAPDSSQNTMAALRRRAAARILGPVLGHPAGNRPLVALDGAAGGALQAVAHAVAQQLPGVAGMVGDPGQLLDHRRDSGKGPVVGVEAVREGAFAQRLVNGGKLLVGQARGGAGRAGAAERVLPALAPTGVPAADDLPGHTQLVGDLGLGVAGGKQLPGLHADAFERLAVAQTTGVAAVGGWSHPAMLPGQPRSCHRKGRASFKATVRGSSPWRRTPQNPQVSPRCTAGAFYVHSLRLGTFGHARDAVGWIIRAGRTFRRDTVCRSVECDGGEVAAAVELYGPKAASASPRKSSNSTLSGTPGVSWVNSWLPIPVSPPADPGSTLTAPANSKEPTVSPSTPTARSTKPSSPKAPAASAMPNPSRNSALSSTPGLSWVNSWLPAPGTPGLSWVNSWLPIPVSPPADPESTLTAPPRSLAPKSSRGADGQVDEAVAVEVASAEHVAEVVVRLGAADHPGAVLGEQLAPGTRQPASGAVQHVHGPRVDDGAHVLQRHPDRQVGEAIAVEVANRQRITEAVAELSGPRHPGVLREELAAGTRQPARGAIQHIHGTSVADGAQILTGDTDGQVSEATVVEVGPQTLRGLFGRRTAGQTARHWPDRGRKKQDEDHRDPPHLHHLLSSGPRWPARRATNLHLGTWRTRKKAAAEEEPPGSVATFGH